MTRIVAVTACPTGVAHTIMAAEALKHTAAHMAVAIRVETQGSAGARDVLSASEITEADVVIVAADTHVDTDRFAGKPVLATRTSDAIRSTRAVIQAALALAASDTAASQSPVPAGASPTPPPPPDVPPGKRLVGVTACPTGIAHTFMAAAALDKAARALGHAIKIETQGSVGAKNQLTEEDIAGADAVVIAADTTVDVSRFAGKPVFTTSTKAAMHDPRGIVRATLAQPAVAASAPISEHASRRPAAGRPTARTGPYKHLMTGVSYMLPVVIAGGLAMALAFAIGGIQAADHPGTLAAALSRIGGGTAFHLFVAVLSAFLAYSIADRPGIAPGLVGGMLAQELGAGFLGGLISGFLAGYLTRYLAVTLRLPRHLEGLKPVLILPFVSTIAVGLLMIYVIAPPVQALNATMNAWLAGMQGANAAVLGAVLGGMMALDMGGPVNKAAYTFAVGLLAGRIYTPMAAVMAAGMTPALGVGLAALLFRRRFDAEERTAGGPALVLGLSFITEGAIPFAAKDPLRVIPALVLGSATAGAISMVSGVQLLVPHGGLFAAVIPGAVVHLLPYLGAIVTGSAVTVAGLLVLKRPLREDGAGVVTSR
jgi:PTS system fructose-specific IIC component